MSTNWFRWARWTMPGVFSLVQKFVTETGFQELLAVKVALGIAYGLGWISEDDMLAKVAMASSQNDA